MKRINLKDYDLQIENPVDKEILQLLLDNLQYRYNNPKFCDAMYDHVSDIPQLTKLSATIIDNDIHNIQIGSTVSADFKDAISFQTALAGTCSLVFDIDADHVVKNIKLLWN